MTDVFNLTTGEVVSYDLDPVLAVLAAHMQMDKHNYNWWGYPPIQDVVRVSSSGKSVAAGEWTALVKAK